MMIVLGNTPLSTGMVNVWGLGVLDTRHGWGTYQWGPTHLVMDAVNCQVWIRRTAREPASSISHRWTSRAVLYVEELANVINRNRVQDGTQPGSKWSARVSREL